MALDLTLAVGDYDRVRPLRTGEVVPDGIDLRVADPEASPDALFKQVVSTTGFECTEMSLSSFAMWTASGDCPFVGIPAFPSRFFRHASIYVRTDAGIDEPVDLRGRRVGIPEYQMTAATMVRGLLQHEYGVAPSSMTWCTAREEKLPFEPPAGTHIERFADDDEDLVDRFEAGELDALVSTLIPDLADPGVRRLFPDFKAVERDYFERTGIYPIMHTLVLDAEVYAEHPWVAEALYDAMGAAKDLAMARLYTNRALPVSLPWLLDHVEEARATFGDDWWPYGFEPNRPSLEALTTYAHEQGLLARPVTPEELFVAELHDT